MNVRPDWHGASICVRWGLTFEYDCDRPLARLALRGVGELALAVAREEIVHDHRLPPPVLEETQPVHPRALLRPSEHAAEQPRPRANHCNSAEDMPILEAVARDDQRARLAIRPTQVAATRERVQAGPRVNLF